MPEHSEIKQGEIAASTSRETEIEPELLKLEWKKNFFKGQEIDPNLQQEIAQRVQVRRINGMWVCFYMDEVSEYGLEERIARSRRQTKILKHFVDNPNTKGVMIEYFAPELKDNARKSSLLAKMFILSSLSLPKYRDRVFGFNYLALLAKSSHKDVYVADIANKPSYQGLRIGWAYAPGAVAASLASRPNSPLALAISSMSGGFLSAFSQEAISRVTPNKNKLEEIIPTPEDARRVFVAKGIQEITSRLSNRSEQNEQSERGTLLVVYPEAHVNRIIKYLENESKKEKIYKVTLPGLDYTVRVYRPTQKPDQQFGQDLSGWQLVEKIPL